MGVSRGFSLATNSRLLTSKTKWDKTRPKGRCQCDACGEREGEGQNCSYLHGNHPSSAMLRAGASLWGWRSIKNKQTIAVAVKYPIRSAAIVISIPPLGTMRQKPKKSCALRHIRDCARNGIIPGPLVATANAHLDALSTRGLAQPPTQHSRS